MDGLRGDSSSSYYQGARHHRLEKHKLEEPFNKIWSTRSWVRFHSTENISGNFFAQNSLDNDALNTSAYSKLVEQFIMCDMHHVW